MNVFEPTRAQIVALASAVVHAAEFVSKDGRELDLTAFESALSSPEIKTWLSELGAFVPLRRDGAEPWEIVR